VSHFTHKKTVADLDVCANWMRPLG